MNIKTTLLIVFLLLVAVLLGYLKLKGPVITVDSPPEVEENSDLLSPEVLAPTTEEYQKTIGDFLVTGEEVCLTDDRPAIYYFGSETCPHCQWEGPILKKVVNKFGSLIDFRDNTDNQADLDIFSKYSKINSGYIPFLVLGCQYIRLGSGENVGEAVEEENLTALICKLTGSKPEAICLPLQEKISEIK